MHLRISEIVFGRFGFSVQPAEHEWLAVVTVDVPLDSVVAKATG